MINLLHPHRFAANESATDYLSAGGNFFPTLASGGNLYQDLSGGTTTPATANPNPVGTVIPEGSGAFTMFALSNGFRPLVGAGGALLDWDGVDDVHEIRSGTRTSDMYVAYIVNSSQTTTGGHFGNAPSASQYFGISANGSGFLAWDGVGTPTLKANGVTVGTNTRTAFYNAAHTGSPVLIEWIGIDLSNANFANMEVGQRGTDQLDGLLGDIVIDVNSASVRDNIPAFLASRHGITL